MFTLRPIRVKVLPCADPVGIFTGSTKIERTYGKEIIYHRITGVGGDTTAQTYVANLQTIVSDIKKDSRIPFLHLNRLKTFAPSDNTDKYIAVYTILEQVMASGDPEKLFQAAFPVQFKNSALQWSAKRAYALVLEIFKKTHPAAGSSLAKNFGVKLLYWIDAYLPLLNYTAWPISGMTPKILFTGDIKEQECLFLHYLAQIGCDILYINPESDMPGSLTPVLSFSKHITMGPPRKIALPDPEALNTALSRSAVLTAVAAPVQAAAVQQPAISAPRRSHRPEISIPSNPQPSPTLVDKELTYEELAGFSDAVVMIRVADEEGAFVKSGSGVIISPKGYILTNLHVVKGGSRFMIKYENDPSEYYTNTIIKYHTEHDLALIATDKHTRPIAIKNGGTLSRGQKIIAIGSPLGLFNSVSDGIISAFRQLGDTPMIQFTAPISNGSSGGAVLNMKGELIGLSTAGFDKGQNLNLAVDYHTIRNFLHNFI